MQTQIDRFLNHMRVGRSASDLTLKAYRGDLRDFFLFLHDACGCPLPEAASPEEILPFFTAANVRRYSSALLSGQYHRSTIGRKLSAIKSFSRFTDNHSGSFQHFFGQLAVCNQYNFYH